MPTNQRYWIAVTLGFLLALLLRLWGISSFSLWHDEGYSIVQAQMPLNDLFTFLATVYLGPPLYPLINKMMVTLLPSIPWAIRLVSLTASLATSAILFFSLLRLQGKRPALFGLFIFAVSPIAVMYAQEGRNYALFCFLYTAAFFSILFFLKTKSKKVLVLHAGAVLGLLYTHGLGVMWAAALQLVFFLGRPDRHHLKKWVVTYVGIAVFFLPWVPIFLGQVDRAKNNVSLEQAWAGNSWYSAPLGSLRNLVPGDQSPRSKAPIAHLPKGSLFLSIFAFAVVLVVSRYRQKDESGYLMVAAILTPLFLVAIYSDLVKPTFQMGRLEMGVSAIFCAFLGVSLSQIKKSHLNISIFVIFLLSGLVSNFIYHFSPTFPQKVWDERTAKSLSFEDSGLMVFDVQTRDSVLAYTLCRNSAKPLQMFPDPKGLGYSATAWRNLQDAGLISPNDLNQSLAHLGNRVEIEKVNRLSIVAAAMGLPEGGFQTHPYIQSLLVFLQGQGFLQKEPRVFPMDWQNNGYHLIYNLERE